MNVWEDRLLPITDYELLQEVSDEMGIPLKDVEKTYSIWIKYLKHISKETEQTTIAFPNLGQMYFSTERCKNITSKQEKDYRNKKLKHIYEFFEGLEFENFHERVPIVHRWGVNRPNFSKYGSPKFTINELVDKQNERFFKKPNKFIKDFENY